MPIVNIIATLVIAFAGAIGNLTIIYVFIQYKSLRCVNNIFVVQLSIVDLIKALTLLPLKAAMQASMEMHLVKTVCYCSGFLSAMAFVHSPLVLAAIAVVRYIIVVKPHLYLTLCSRSRIVKYSLFLLAIASLFSVLPFIGIGKYTYSIHHGVCFADWSRKNIAFRTILYMLTMGTTYPVMVLCYCSIFYKLKKHGRRLSRAMSSNPGSKRKNCSYKSTESNGDYELRQYPNGKRVGKPTGSHYEKIIDLNKVNEEITTERFSAVDHCYGKSQEILTELELKPSKGHHHHHDSTFNHLNLSSEEDKQEWIAALNRNTDKVENCLHEEKAQHGMQRYNLRHKNSGMARPCSYTCFEALKNSTNEKSTGHQQAIKKTESMLQGKALSCDVDIKQMLDIQRPANATCCKCTHSLDSHAKQRSVNNTFNSMNTRHINGVQDISAASAAKILCPEEKSRISFNASSDQNIDSSVEMQSVRRKMSRLEIKVTKIMFIIVLAYTVCWLPAFLVNILMLSKAINISDNVLYLIVTLVDFKVLLNPLIYGVGSPMIRSAIYSSIFKRGVGN
ncbi:uncharacterized protein LOC135695085 [Rhopilema esculentum]|uniref:uncharacterized protein LOC135695085 n=1 Tax=Rhopilema esculentum TaxID=499914 RepID=UPI0031D86D18|eukprot:gene4870-21197_t